MTTRIQLEVCIASLRDAMIATKAGATRLELNSAFELGGLTPSPALTELVVEAAQSTRCKVIAMVRPRPGGFAYDDDELRVMQRNIDYLLQLGVDGVAFGVLHNGGTIDVQACRKLIGQVADRGREAVFHRAFDLTPDPLAALDTLIALGFDRVLTSGGKATALEGAQTIRALIQQAGNRIEVLPGGGIRPHNVAELVAITGCCQVHASLRTDHNDRSTAANPTLNLGASPAANSAYSATDPAKVSAMIEALAGL